MAIQSPFFGKRELDNTTTGVRPAGVPPARTPGLQGSSGLSASAASAPSSAATATAQTDAAAQATASATGAPAGGGAVKEPGSRLTVGPNIKLKGVEITDCDTLFVEGTVEATMDSRLMQIAEGGAFKGSADIDIAEIHGEFDGQLTAREKLVIHATGKVTGTVRYGKLVIEEGGQISGEIHVGAASALGAKAPAAPRPNLQSA